MFWDLLLSENLQVINLTFQEITHLAPFSFFKCGFEHIWLSTTLLSLLFEHWWLGGAQLKKQHTLSARNLVLNPHLNEPGRTNSGPKNFWKTDKLIMHIIASWLLLLLWQDLIITSKVCVGTHISFKWLQDDTLQ